MFIYCLHILLAVHVGGVELVKVCSVAEVSFGFFFLAAVVATVDCHVSCMCSFYVELLQQLC